MEPEKESQITETCEGEPVVTFILGGSKQVPVFTEICAV